MTYIVIGTIGAILHYLLVGDIYKCTTCEDENN